MVGMTPGSQPREVVGIERRLGLKTNATPTADRRHEQHIIGQGDRTQIDGRDSDEADQKHTDCDVRSHRPDGEQSDDPECQSCCDDPADPTTGWARPDLSCGPRSTPYPTRHVVELPDGFTGRTITFAVSAVAKRSDRHFPIAGDGPGRHAYRQPREAPTLRPPRNLARGLGRTRVGSRRRTPGYHALVMCGAARFAVRAFAGSAWGSDDAGHVDLCVHRATVDWLRLSGAYDQPGGSACPISLLREPARSGCLHRVGDRIDMDGAQCRAHRIGRAAWHLDEPRVDRPTVACATLALTGAFLSCRVALYRNDATGIVTAVNLLDAFGVRRSSGRGGAHRSVSVGASAGTERDDEPDARSENRWWYSDTPAGHSR